MTQKRPNILLINCDDLGFGDLGCYGSSRNRTPALDRLADEGVRFTDFYMVSAVCTPSRAGMMTGCYPQRIGMNRVLFPADNEGLHPKEATMASMLKKQNYATGLVGKWHLGDQPDFLPTRFGFDRYFGLPYSNDMGRQTGDSVEKTPLPLMDGDRVVEAQPEQAGLTARYVDWAKDFIRESKEAGQPFFLYFAHMYVHLPLYVPDRFLRESSNGHYGAAVACIDWAWQQLDTYLDALGLQDDTIVLFTSDNGSRGGGDGGSNEPLRGGKFTTWEGGFRLPLIARWHGKFPAGATCSGMLASMDLLPTMAAWSGTEPEYPRGPIDGESFAHLFEAPEASGGRETFAYFSEGNLAALRVGPWKRHYSRRTGWKQPFEKVDELYNLELDVGEQSNQFETESEKVMQMDALAEALRSQLGDIVTDTVGRDVRSCGLCEHPEPLLRVGHDCPLIVAEYDLADRG